MTAKTPWQEANDAIDSIENSFEKDKDGMLVGADEFLAGCESLASAFVELREPEEADEEDAPPLDEVLAELEVESELVDDVADLLKLAGKMSYGGPIYTNADKTLSQVEDVVSRLRDVLAALNENENEPEGDPEG